MKRSPASDIALIASFAALIAVCAVLPSVSLGPVPITLQTFGVLLTGFVLGSTRGFLANVLYLVLGAAGLPVFAGGAAGLAPFVGPTVGYLVAFPLAAWLAGFIVERVRATRVAIRLTLLVCAGLGANLVFIHTLGPLGLMWRANMTPGGAFIFELSFLPGDIIKTVLAASVAVAVHRAFPALMTRTRYLSPARQAAVATPGSPAATAGTAEQPQEP